MKRVRFFWFYRVIIARFTILYQSNCIIAYCIQYITKTENVLTENTSWLGLTLHFFWLGKPERDYSLLMAWLFSQNHKSASANLANRQDTPISCFGNIPSYYRQFYFAYAAFFSVLRLCKYSI